MKKLWNRGRYCLSLLMASALSFTACTDDSDIIQDGADNKLQVNFAVNSHGSRAINRETSLPDGSQVRACLSGYSGYENLVYTASTGKTPQAWTGDKDVVLSDVSGTLYAFYPYNKDIDITAIPVDMTAADQTDWLYGTPVIGVNDLNPEVDVTMNHALANINLSIVGDNYAGDGNISSISVQSDGIASKGTFNAAQATPGYSAFTVKGEALERSVATTLGATATDIMVIPTGTESAITFFVTVDDVVYTVQSAPLTLEMGYSYQYTLKLKSTYMSVDGVSVTPWNNVSKEDYLELGKYNPWDYVANGVYAVSADGKPVEVSKADASCVAVAFISANQKVMIAKADATDGTNQTLYWGNNLYQQDVPNLEYRADNPSSQADYNGKANTSAIIAGYAALGKDMDSRDMCKVLETYNEAGYTDWYVPAAGQLCEFTSNIVALNKALTAISGNSFTSDCYWSSSEYSSKDAWLGASVVSLSASKIKAPTTTCASFETSNKLTT